LVGLDSHRGRAFIDGAHECRLGARLDIGIGRDGVVSLIFARVAGSIFACISVVILQGHLVGLSILEGPGKAPSVAAVRVSLAIDELLLREGVELARMLIVDSFEGSSSGEGPA